MNVVANVLANIRHGEISPAQKQLLKIGEVRQNGRWLVVRGVRLELRPFAANVRLENVGVRAFAKAFTTFAQERLPRRTGERVGERAEFAANRLRRTWRTHATNVGI